MATMEVLPNADVAVSLPPARSFHDETLLLEALRQGDRGAAEALVEDTYEMVFRTLVRLSGDPDTAADLTQETYARAWKALDGFRGGSRFGTWLYRIAYTTYLNHVRRPQRFSSVDVEDLELPAPSDTGLGARLDAARLRRAVMALPENLRFCVTARFWGELPVRDIAVHEGITKVAIRKRLRRAVELLRQALSEDPSS